VNGVVIAGYARIPFARYCGAFAGVAATELGVHAARSALLRSGIEAGEVRRVVAGQVLQGGAGQNPARQTAVAAGIPLSVPAVTVNVVCLSGMEAVQQAARLIASHEADIVLAVGQESMTQAPHATSRARAGARYGSLELIDTMDHDGLTDAFERVSMGASTAAGNAERNITREEQDLWAAGSHQRAAAASELLSEEIAPYTRAVRSGETVVADDDAVRADTSVATLSRLRPAFGDGGTITAGNGSQLTDGAADVVVMSEAAAAKRGLEPMARIVSARGCCTVAAAIGAGRQPPAVVADRASR
jgi:acetyl-CoA C-acetyltransferase